MFSQVAQAVGATIIPASYIDKNNYKFNLCDDNLFKTTVGPSNPMVNPPATRNPVVPQPATRPINTPTIADTLAVRTHYQSYCYHKGYYEAAVEDGKKAGRFTQVRACPANGVTMHKDKCLENSGVAFAQACANLKEDKRDKKDAWNAVVPTLETCNNARRLR